MADNRSRIRVPAWFARCAHILGCLFLLQLMPKVCWIGIMLLICLSSSLWNVWDPIPGLSLADSFSVAPKFSWEVIRYPFGELSLFGHKPKERVTVDEPRRPRGALIASRTAGRMEYLSEFTLPYDARNPAISLTDELVTNQSLKSKYLGTTAFVADRESQTALRDIESVLADAHNHGQTLVYLIGHNESGIYKWRVGSQVMELDHTLVDAVAAKQGVEIIHLSCDSASFSSLGIRGIKRSYAMADRIIEAGAAITPLEHGRILGLADEAAIAERSGGELRTGLRKVRPLEWLGRAAFVYDIYSTGRDMHKREKDMTFSLSPISPSKWFIDNSYRSFGEGKLHPPTTQQSVQPLRQILDSTANIPVTAEVSTSTSQPSH